MSAAASREPRRRCLLLVLLIAGFSLLPGSLSPAEPRRFPHIVLVSVDTLRYDRLSIHGHRRPTSPHLDALLTRGARFTQARVTEPLTSPSMCSMLTSLDPHEHGSSRNGLAMRPGLPAFTGILERRGYRTAAFIGNWTLRDKLSGLGEHFDEYHEVFSRKRWMGMFNSEATAKDLTEEALDWIEEYLGKEEGLPFLLWVHYVEPHAPYRMHPEFAERLKIKTDGSASPEERYDTEVAFVDEAIGDLLTRLEKLAPRHDTLVIFLADHGESLGEHGYWGHGRHLYDVTLRVPLGIVWEGRITPQTVDAPASLLDVGPTLLGLVGLPVPELFVGFNWAPVLRREAEAPAARVTRHQAHKGAVHSRNGNEGARRRGLLEVGQIADGKKEIYILQGGGREVFDLAADPREAKSLVQRTSRPSAELLQWLEDVRAGLVASDALPPPSLDEESLEKLRALGYID